MKKWFYDEVDAGQQEDFKDMVMSPLEISFGLKRQKRDMGKADENCYKAFNAVVEKIRSRYLIQ